MTDNKYIVRYDGFNNRIRFPRKINSYIITHFASALNEWKKRRRYEPLILDFSAVGQPYSNGMLAIICAITELRHKNQQSLKIRLPNDKNVRELFYRTNWAHLLDPELPRSDLGAGRHLHTRQFADFRDVPIITNDFMDIVLRNMSIPKDIVSALEWSINEICDNVINHSESQFGGFVEAVTYSKERMITFTVADGGRGILKSLREGIPDLSTSDQAIAEAIKEGVTRNKKAGQGNGLAGSLRITTMTGGSLDITSGAGRFYSTNNHTNAYESSKDSFYNGTSVSGQILMSKNFSIGNALVFNGRSYIPENIIDLKYEKADDDSLQLNMATETTGVGTRRSGKELRVKTQNLMISKPGYPIYIDWKDIPVISSSFADEFIGKVYVELGQATFNGLIRNINMEPLIQQLLDKAISQRRVQGL